MCRGNHFQKRGKTSSLKLFENFISGSQWDWGGEAEVARADGGNLVIRYLDFSLDVNFVIRFLSFDIVGTL